MLDLGLGNSQRILTTTLGMKSDSHSIYPPENYRELQPLVREGEESPVPKGRHTDFLTPAGGWRDGDDGVGEGRYASISPGGKAGIRRI